MVFCTIEEAWGNNFSNNNNSNNNSNNSNNSNIDYKNINYDDINYNNIDLDKNRKIDEKKETKKINNNIIKGGKNKIKKNRGGKKKIKVNKKKIRKLKGGNLLSEDFDIFYYIIIGIILVILVDTFYKLGKNN